MAQDTYAVTHVMVDIETLGTAPGSAIVSIGAVAFNPFSEDLGRTFEIWIDPYSAVVCGLRMDPRTVVWWMGQSEAAQRATFGRMEAQPLTKALGAFAEWIRDTTAASELRLWGHGANFDAVLLGVAYDACAIKTPWSFRDARDTRTIFDLAGIIDLAEFRSADDIEHVALTDAKVQARAVCDAYRRLQIKELARG